jgi:hypothetical protein
VCTNGTCAPQCIPNCVQKSCGDDGCGGSCGVCPKDFSCDLGKCMPAPSGCGNVTSAGLCDGTKLLKCVSGQVVTVDCAAGGKVCAYSPPAGVYDCVLTCLPNCAGKMCGEDGCGGSCGTCGKGDQCLAGVCEPLSPCIPDCAGRTCGDDGCGGSCGSCADGQVCKAGVCADEGAAECPDGQEWNGTECTAAEPGDNAGGSSGGCAVGTPGSNALTLVLLLLALGSILSYARRPGAGRA